MIPQFNQPKFIKTDRSLFKQTIKYDDLPFQKKFKLTQKIHQLSSSIYQRSLSPWTRRRNQSIDRKNYHQQQTNLPLSDSIYINQNDSKIPNPNNIINPNNTLNSNNIIPQNKLNDFLRKIQFTKRKNILGHQKNKKSFTLQQDQSFQLNNQIQNINNFGQQDVKKIIIYPKLPCVNKVQEIFLSPSNKNKEKINKQKIQTKRATIQNFYDPFQNSPNKRLAPPISSKRSQNPVMKIQDSQKQQNPIQLNNIATLPLALQSTYRKNSFPQKQLRDYKQFRQTKNTIDQNNYSTNYNFHKNFLNTQKKFFNTNRMILSRRMMTEPTDINRQKQTHNKQNPQQSLIQTQPTYVTPSGQAIKRIKQQHKRSRRNKTQIKNQTHNVQNSLSCHKKQQRQFLYKTFLNYKSQKHSNDLNITKTLKFNYHNKQSFSKNLEKSLTNVKKV